MNWYLEVLKKYTEFTGRARRTEYWMFTLVNVIVYIVLGVVLSMISVKLANAVVVLYGLGVLLPSLAVLARRLHDTGRTAWWILIGLVPIIGPIVLIVFCVLDSDAGENQYGPSPK